MYANACLVRAAADRCKSPLSDLRKRKPVSVMIDLGLARSYSLLTALGSPQSYFKAFHIAGTNGKGSVVSYLSSILVQHGVTVGKFTSPHLITENDGICINDIPVSMERYQEVGNYVRQIDQKFHIGATEFETQTAIAFEIFRRNRVKFAVVEVGLGGLLDATNVLSPTDVLCTGITKISLDHESFLGTTLPEIAKHKAGIIKFGVPCVVDGTNDQQVKDAIQICAKDLDSHLYYASELPPEVSALVSPEDLLLGDFQMQNAAIAAKIAAEVHVPAETIAQGLKSTVWRGRLDWITYKGTQVLVDGAHNVGAAKELAKYTQNHFSNEPISWVVAFSKPCDAILPLLVRPQDSVVCTSFGDIDGMPWIKAQDPQDIAKVAQTVTPNVEVVPNIANAAIEDRKNVVVCGSLYLLKDILL